MVKPVVPRTVVQNPPASLFEQITMIMESLERAKAADDPPSMLRAMKQLFRHRVPITVMRETEVGKLVSSLKKHGDTKVKSAATQLKSKMQKDVDDQLKSAEQPDQVAANAPSAPPAAGAAPPVAVSEPAHRSTGGPQTAKRTAPKKRPADSRSRLVDRAALDGSLKALGVKSWRPGQREVTACLFEVWRH